MRYLCLAFADDAVPADEWRDYETALRDGGHYVHSHVLRGPGAIVRNRQGRTTVAEGGRQPSSMVLIEAEDLNQALQLASRHPSARLGCIEVQPIQDPGPACRFSS